MSTELSTFEAKFIKVQFGLATRLALYKKIAAFLEEGVPIHDILNALAGQYEKLKKGDIRAKVLRDLSLKIENGIKFSDALADWAPASEVMLIKAGETGGDMKSAFRNAIYTTEAASRMKGTIKSETSYPALLLIVLACLIYGFSTEAVPQLTSVLEPSNWPPMAKKLYDMSQFVEHKWFLVVAGFFGFLFVSIQSLPIFTGKIRSRLLDHVPPWSIYKTFQSSVFLISVSAMMKTGTPIYESIAALHKMSPKYVQKELDKILEALSGGESVGKSLNQGFLEKETGIDVEIYGDLSNIQESLERIGAEAIETGIDRIKASAVLMKNLVLFGVASYVGWVYYAFFTLTQSIGQLASTGM
ncbi:type II secretion system F family protein [Vibrio harveyi]|uniref:type II secretion system F family protein n=1 Tax=Vibrio harveyi TaxID=669 RepID=UPI003CEEBA6F